MAKYTVQQHAVDTLLAWVKSGQIAIPEMQRPFVWTSIKVRDLVDSLYQGYPIGYLITWQSVDVGLKDGSVAGHKQILIDGQQRITAMTAALVGQEVLNKRYRKERIKIAFNPITEEFATWTPFIGKDPQWIGDIAEVINGTSLFGIVGKICRDNPDADPEQIERNVSRLQAVKHAQVGVITLADDLDIETVTEIFIRVNSKGVPLSSADFAMSKIASFGDEGSALRKLIDYFCHLAIAPHVYDDILANDPAFTDSGYLAKIAWLRKDSEDLYDPTYGDIIRVAGLAGFKRGRPAALVGYLSGRDFEARTNDPALVAPAFEKLRDVLLRITNEYNFKQFMIIIRSTGFISPSMIVAKNALNFAYALYLILLEDSSLTHGDRQRIVRGWFVMSMLTGRHSGSFESRWEQDIRRIGEVGAAALLRNIEETELTDSFWDAALPDRLNTSSSENPIFKTFLAAQVFNHAKGFLSDSVTVQAMLQEMGDIHHVVPKDYLVKSGITDRSLYNQVGNYVMAETPVNIKISNKVPGDYLALVCEQIADGQLRLGGITSGEVLTENMRQNAIPENLAEVTAESYGQFLVERRRLMASLLKDYYRSL